MVNKSAGDVIKERPVFIPPRKRQSKKSIGPQNCAVDHIVNVQNRQKLSPSNPGLEGDLLKTSLILKNKQPLPQIPGFSQNDLQAYDQRSNDRSATSTQRSTKSSLHSVTNLFEDDNELQNFEKLSQGTKSINRHESSTVTPTSYSESSLIEQKLSKSNDCIINRSLSKKRVNICTELKPTRTTQRLSPDITNYEDLESGETSVLHADDYSLEHFHTRKSCDNKYLKMTGTIKRGSKKGQSLDVQVNISREELEQINAVAIAAEVKKKRNLCCICSLNTGLHIFLLSLICLPFVTLTSSMYAFYIGTLTWYNMFNFFNEEKSYLYKFIMCPILILAYPVGILACTLGLGFYAGFVQLSLQFHSWINEVADIEKGFYGWLCSFLHLSDCCPYEVVILTEIQLPTHLEAPCLHVNNSTKELTL